MSRALTEIPKLFEMKPTQNANREILNRLTMSRSGKLGGISKGGKWPKCKNFAASDDRPPGVRKLLTEATAAAASTTAGNEMRNGAEADSSGRRRLASSV